MSIQSMRNLDLNLLVALDALLAEANVTRAAERVGVSQPSMSASLRRLRRHFDDELLRRTGNSYQLTPLARRLAPQLGSAMSAVARVFDTREDFDPAAQRREFTIAGSDYVNAILGPALADLVALRAPNVTLRLQQQVPHIVMESPESLERVDGLLLPHGFLSDLPHLDLFEDSWVLLVSDDNPFVTADSISAEALGQLPWVVLYNMPTAYNPAQLQLRFTGLQARVEVAVDTFLVMPYLIAGTERVALLQASLAERMPTDIGLRTVPVPYPVAPISEAFWWHPVHEEDPGHRWLRELLVEAAAAASPR